MSLLVFERRVVVLAECLFLCSDAPVKTRRFVLQANISLKSTLVQTNFTYANIRPCIHNQGVG